MDALGFLVMVSLPTYLVAQSVMLLVYRGRWRWIAAAPLVVMGPALAFAGVAFAQKSNLWPIIPILAAPFACLALGVIAAIHKAASTA